MTSLSKEVYWRKKAEELTEHIDQIHYGEYDKKQLAALREITHIIHPADKKDRQWRKIGFSFNTPSYHVFETLEDAFYRGEVSQEINRLLHEHERYELLAVLIKM